MKGEITIVLYKDQIKYLKAEGVWPKEFDEPAPATQLGKEINSAWYKEVVDDFITFNKYLLISFNLRKTIML